jgi:hypothetical protein
MVNMRGNLVGIPSYSYAYDGAQGVNFAIAMDTVNAFFGMPQSAVNWSPPAPIYRGDPRDVMLSVSDFSGGGGQWVLDTENPADVAKGVYGRVFSVLPSHDPMVTALVVVFPHSRLHRTRGELLLRRSIRLSIRTVFPASARLHMAQLAPASKRCSSPLARKT